MNLFVYGTLQSGYGNNVLLRGAEFLGQARTDKEYVLFHCGFPKAVPYTENNDTHPLLPVIGELWRVDDKILARCDELEGHPRWYRRTRTSVWLSENLVEGEIYEMPEWQGDRPTCSIIDNNGINVYKWARF